MDLDMDFSHTPVVAWSSLFTIQDPLGNQQNLVWWIPLPNTPWDYVHRLQLTEVTSCISKCLSKKKTSCILKCKDFFQFISPYKLLYWSFLSAQEKWRRGLSWACYYVGYIRPKSCWKSLAKRHATATLACRDGARNLFFFIIRGPTILIYIKI